MAWIRVIKEDEATGRLKELYDKYAEPSGIVDNILKFQRQFTTRNYSQP